ncbi:transcriptional regulator CynR [Rhodanobacter sp. DHB23]|uniref:transcriptional regulator CynR n=1 Tax=Rhodanobacter sp. DHB23 TaxID=2775923 RepID=UPI001780E2B6|nr:transcriptional regulator CynR [Rhodanobacter sp. DHB23]MBD8874046.1 transcriptional regulator CynR [Rhodanobacter sp. DHB23]
MLLRHIRYFLAVAEHGSFTRAAAALHVSQPALSQQIRQLEETLGAALFDRSGRSTRLTDAGTAYLQHARRALLDLEAGRRALHDVRDLSRGTLRLGVMPTLASYLVGPLAAAFHRSHPGIALDIHEMPQERIEALLLDDRLDVGIAFDRAGSPEVASEALLTETLALVVGREHPGAGRRSTALQALERESLALLSGEFATRRQIDLCCRRHGLRPHVAIEANAVDALLEIVRRTHLATLLPTAVACGDDLHAIALRPALLERTVVLLQRNGAYQAAAARAFVELARAWTHGKRKANGPRARAASHSQDH